MSMSVEGEIEAAARSVFESIGAGHSESAYHAAFEVELSARGRQFNSEGRLVVKHRGQTVAHRRPDLMVSTPEGPVIVELKANKRLREKHRRQAESYVALAREDANVESARSAMLINFSPNGVTVEMVKEPETVDSFGISPDV